MPLSNDTQERIQAIKRKVEEVGQAMGIPQDQAAAIVVVDTIEQHAVRQTRSVRGVWQAIWKGLGVIKAEVEIIFGWKK